MPLRLWSVAHDNGWETWIADGADGTFAAWACQANEDATRVYVYVEDSYDHAAAAALFALAQRSGHQSCTSKCSAWEEREPLPIADHAQHLSESDQLPTTQPREGAIAKKAAKRKTAAKTAKKKTAKRKGAAKREPISPRGGARYIRRDAKGRIKESDDVSRSHKADRRTKAKRKVKSGQGDKGDR
jgi:hypothetical protein